VAELRALIVDWGGVLTGDIKTAVEVWAETESVDLKTYVEIMRDWFGAPFGAEASVNPIHALERGEISMPHFDVKLAAELTARTGHPYVAEGLLARMFDCFVHVPEMTALVRRARSTGLRTALLSNSWGNEYPRDAWEDVFDILVISGEIGMRKPEPRIFDHTLERLGLEAGECVFVDDLAANIEAAAALGFVGVLHRSYEETRSELEILFGRDLS